MRKRILVLLLAAACLLAAVCFGEGTYRPFQKLSASDLTCVTLVLSDGGAQTFTDREALSRCAEAMQAIGVLFTADSRLESRAALKADFSSGGSVEIVLYPDGVAIDGKGYSLSQEDADRIYDLIRDIQ